MISVKSFLLIILTTSFVIAGVYLIQPTDVNALVSGQIMVDPNNPSWFVYNKDSDNNGKLDPYFLSGPGDPENFLYRGSRNSDGTRNGDQTTLINKLINNNVNSKTANGIYMQIVRSHGGDGDNTHNPFTNSSGSKDSGGSLSLNQNILNQWHSWFSLMDQSGITIYLFFYDDSARVWNTGNTVGNDELNFIQGIVNEFKIYKHIIWVVAEEYSEGYSATRISNIASIIRSTDDHNHPIAVHQNNGLSFAFSNDSDIDQFSIQYNNKSADQLNSGMVSTWSNSAGNYNLNMSESAGHYSSDRTAVRQKNWAAAMGGAYVMVFEMFIDNTPNDHIRDLARMRDFFESTVFNEMSPNNSYIAGSTNYVLANPGSSYILYSRSAGSLGVRNLTSGTYDLLWYDTTTGSRLTQSQTLESGDHTFTKPAGFSSEVALYLTRHGSTDATPTSTPQQTTPPTPTYVPGDANNDGVVDGLDYLIWLRFYDTSTDNGFTEGDFDGNGFVDGLDYLVWLNNYGK